MDSNNTIGKDRLYSFNVLNGKWLLNENLFHFGFCFANIIQKPTYTTLLTADR